MIRVISLLIILASSSGCTSLAEQRAEFEGKLSTWIGSSIGELLDIWGPPDKSYSLGNKSYLEWKHSITYNQSSYSPGTPATYSGMDVNGIWTPFQTSSATTPAPACT